MSKQSRSKGYRGEKEIRDKLRDLSCNVVWNAEDNIEPDLTINQEFSAEVKYRSSVPLTIYNYLYEKFSDIVFVRRVSRQSVNYKWLAICEAELMALLLNMFELATMLRPALESKLKQGSPQSHAFDELVKNIDYIFNHTHLNRKLRIKTGAIK